MRKLLSGLWFCLLIPPGAWSSTAPGFLPESTSAEYPRICLELMELEAPDSDSGSQMELPPLKGMEEAPAPSKPPAPAPSKPRKKADQPSPAETRGSVTPSGGVVAPGLEPLPMRGPPGVAPVFESPRETTGVPTSVPLQEIPRQLKEVPAPDTGPQKLRVPQPEVAPSRAQESEMPLLGEVPKGVGASSSERQSVPQLMKLPGESASRKEIDVDSRTLLQSDSPEKYLEHSEETDADLIRIYRRFYRKR